MVKTTVISTHNEFYIVVSLSIPFELVRAECFDVAVEWPLSINALQYFSAFELRLRKQKLMKLNASRTKHMLELHPPLQNARLKDKGRFTRLRICGP